ncbi:hypothetical protein AB0F72_19475 [Actinoplanes sp. NPDC023936]|uniref:hypothetical protein n=1 Tax=Actinoplanes sp. NPDC023936 TaxID=3154910 RepID=UPI003405F8CB
MVDGLARRRIIQAALVPVLTAGALGIAGALPAAATTAVRGELLPAPAAGPGEQISVTAVDVSPLGVIAGNAQVTTTAGDGSVSTAAFPQRWAGIPRVGWLRQQLTLPAGATSGRITGLTDLGEAGGSVTLGTTRAARWSIDGRSATLLGDANSSVTTVGANGPWAVLTTDPANPLAGASELVSRAGVRTPVGGTPDLDNGDYRSVSSLGRDGTAMVWVAGGIGQGRQFWPVLWKGDATLRLPISSSSISRPACTSQVQANGSVVYNGFVWAASGTAFELVRHTDGIPGTDAVLARATTQQQPRGGLECAPVTSVGALAPDGGVAGHLIDSNGKQAAYWDAGGTLTVVPLAAGELSATGVAVASGGRMAILTRHDDGISRVSLWDDGVRTPLTTPAGWKVISVVELTEAGLLVANASNAAGVVRPIAWKP